MIIRDCFGMMVGGVCQQVMNESSPKMVEALAELLVSLLSLSLSIIVFQVHSMLVVQATQFIGPNTSA